jgi:hypothetical protein
MSESAEQMHKRLCSVIAAARFEALSQPYAWQQVSKSSRLPANGLAAVRDGSAWYALTSVPPNATGAYRILGVSLCRRLERFGLRRVARWNQDTGSEKGQPGHRGTHATAAACSRPSARIASWTLGRAAIRSM